MLGVGIFPPQEARESLEEVLEGCLGELSGVLGLDLWVLLLGLLGSQGLHLLVELVNSLSNLPDELVHSLGVIFGLLICLYYGICSQLLFFSLHFNLIDWVAASIKFAATFNLAARPTVI